MYNDIVDQFYIYQAVFVFLPSVGGFAESYRLVVDWSTGAAHLVF